MTVAPRSVADVLSKHVVLEYEGIDRMYLNVYVPQLQYEVGIATFFKYHRGYTFASSALMVPMTEAFVKSVDRFVAQRGVPLVAFAKHQRKDDVMKEHLARFKGLEGVLFVGRAQEKAPVVRTERRRDKKTGRPYPWLVKSTAMVNHFYFYCVDRDFGPFFLKFCSYFPYNAKLCINGHEYVKRQLAKQGIKHEALDNGVLSCADPEELQAICDGLSPEKIDALLRKWLRLLPHPFTPADRKAGYRYDVSILQAEFSLTQVLDRPTTGRVFFEEVIRENLDIGRPGQVQLIFERRMTHRGPTKTPGRFRTRVITEGVTPSLHLDYKRTRIKQYHKEGRALRTETTVNDTWDFKIGRRLKNLPALRKIGFKANRRLLDVERISHDCSIGEDAFNRVQQPMNVDGQRAPALRFADRRIQALFNALVLFRMQPQGFRSCELAEHLAPLMGEPPSKGRMTYDLRRLRLRGLIGRIPKTHRYRVTPLGLRTALFFTRTFARVVRPGLALIEDERTPRDQPLHRAFRELDDQMTRWCEQAKLAA
jgi:hypothetical protein